MANYCRFAPCFMSHDQTISKTSFWESIKSSLKGEEHDFTQLPIRRAVLLLAIPMILELSLESVFAVVDMFFVGKLGTEAIATVGYTENVITIVYSLGIGLSTGITAIVARRVGEKNYEGAAHAGAQSLLLALVVSVVLGICGLVFAGDILRLMGGSEKVVAEGTNFTRIMLGSNIVIILLFLINGIFRGAGNAIIAMKSLVLASAINIVLCPLFVHFFGLNGAAVATVIGRGTGVLYQCYYLWKGNGLLKMKREHFRLNHAISGSIIRLSLPATLQFFIASGSWIVMAALVSYTSGTDASAGYQIAIRNVVFFILPAWGLSNAAATLVGQNLGAGQVQRARESVNLITRYNVIFMSVVMLVFLFFSEPIIRIFSTEETVIMYGVRALQIIGAGYIFYGIGMVMTQALNGAGDTTTPTVINFFCFWLFQIPLGCLLAITFDMDATGAFIAVPVAETLIALVAWYYFVKGKWSAKKI